MGYRRVNPIRFACGDSFGAAFAQFNYGEIVEGTFMPDTFAVDYAISSEGTPFSATGIKLAVGQPLNVGPRTTPGAGARLNEYFFRNDSAGSNGFVTFNGTIDDTLPGQAGQWYTPPWYPRVVA